VSFVGARYGWRPHLINGLRRHGIDVACFGAGWPNGPLANEDMNALYGSSRINLGVGGIGYSGKLLCLKGRDFEVPMSGAVYLTQDNPELSLVYDVGREILTYRDVGHCAEVIRALLDDPERAERIRRAARARCLRDHTYAARWTTVFRTLGAVADSAEPQ
jgi:spore maturation protein CgeB